jgi:hypothetical protein
VPLPSFVRTTFASPEFSRRINAEGDITTRVTGRCVRALIVNKLVGDFQLCISFTSGAYDTELACISSLLDTEPGEFSRCPRPSAVIKLQNVVYLLSGEVVDLFTSGAPPADLIQIVQQTLDDICSDLVRGKFSGEDLPMNQVLLLREICSKIANVRPVDRFTDETVGILERLQLISKQLPTVERKMWRCTSSVFGLQRNSTTRPERRRRSKSM